MQKKNTSKIESTSGKIYSQEESQLFISNIGEPIIADRLQDLHNDAFQVFSNDSDYEKWLENELKKLKEKK